MSSDDLRGTCYGFAVDTSLSFDYLRHGSGEPLRVEIEETPFEGEPGTLLREWTIRHPEPFRASLYAAEEAAYRLWTADSGWFSIDPTYPRVSLPANGNAVKREERLWGIPTLLCFIARGDLPLHAAAVEAGEGAILLAAPGRFGKTTLAAGFARAGKRLLSEDLSCLRLGADATVVPGPAMLRIRPDVAEALDIPRALVLEAGDERLHLALESSERGDCTPVPVGAVVFLRGGSDGIQLQRSDPHEAVRDLYGLSFRLPGAAEVTRAFRGVAELVATVPTWDLSYPLRLEELDRVVETVACL
jgi:hypothetical protein